MELDPKETQKIAEEHAHEYEEPKKKVGKTVKVRVTVEGRPTTLIEEFVKDKFDGGKLVDGIRRVIGEIDGEK